MDNSATSVQASYDFLKRYLGPKELQRTVMISLDGDSATNRNFGKNVTNRSRNGKSAVEGK